VIVEGPASAFGAAVADARRRSPTVLPGFEGARAGIRYGEVRDDASAAQAVLAAMAGAGIVVHATAPRDVIDRLVDDLRRLATVEHRAGEREPDSVLTREQREILSRLADGLTLGQAAEELGLPRRTADRRLAAARTVLGVRTTAEAVVAFTTRR